MREQHGLDMEEQATFHFGNYDLVRRIDVGGMGEVYLARQRTAFGREVAIKIIRSDLVHDLTARARFLREAEVSAHLKHEHILPMFEFGEEQGRLFFATPYIRGGTLAQRLEEGPLTLPEVHTLFTALVQAVAYIHRRGVVHRDLKPSNILLDSEDGHIYVRLIDFGIATLLGKPASPPLTTAGNEIGTIAYMAPERLSGIAAPSNDIYSLGIILYQMWTGHLLTSDHPVKLPPALEHVIHRCITTRLEERWQSADELLQAFEQTYESLSTSPRVSSSVPQLVPMPPLQTKPSVHRENMPPAATHTSIQTDPGRNGVSSQQPENVAFSSPQLPGTSMFSQEDYSAPTTVIGPPASPEKQHSTGTPPASPDTTTTRPPKRRRRSLLTITSVLIVIVLVVIAGMLFYEIPAVSASSATINFSPKTQLINKVFVITAQPSTSTQTISVATTSIPAKVITSNKTDELTGPTTGEECDFIFNCQQTVAAADVSTVTAQLRANLIPQVTSDLQRQLQAANGHAVSKMYFYDGPETYNPAIGSVSKTLTVTLTEKGGIEYIVDSDAKTLARQLLAQQVQKLGPHYILLSSTIKIGSPVIENVDSSSGRVTIKIAAGGVAQYSFPAAELSAMRGHLKSMALNKAHIYIASQEGVDPKSIGIRFTSGGGSTLPEDPQNIRIVTVNPTTLPYVPLQ